jgi:renalase
VKSEVLIVGAGLCGLHAAGRLQAAGRSVLVVEKSRGLGGRAATRRWNQRPVDHGAQFFTAKTPEFAAQVACWEKSGICHEWTRGFHRFADARLHAPAEDAYPRYACRAGMSSLGRALAEPLGDLVRREAKVTRLAVVDGHWEATLDNGSLLAARSLLLTPPPAQSSTLLADAAPEAAKELAPLASHPCLALAACYPRTDIPWQGIQAPDDDVLSWIGHDTGKRPDLHERVTILMLHAAPGFSTAHANTPDEEIAAAMLRRASEMTAHDWTSPAELFIQRWRYALPVPGTVPPGPSVYTTPAPLVVAGDWCAGGRIEGAWLAGRDAADALLALPGD